jgi:eukaryotic-like serine/threonine-protein kinase
LPDNQPLIDALASQYRIERELGRGGFATVFLAQDLRHDRPVALKVLHAEVAESLGFERFKQEIRVSARLQHPNILGVFDSGEAGNKLWFTMPFIEGESLRNRIDRDRQLPVAEAVTIAREVGGALDYAHRHGVIHRDIKPENILLSDGYAFVADFGIARALGAGGVTQTGMVVGTPAYMSPEQGSGGAVDARSDVYAVGCVLYEMLAGEPPFTGPTAAIVLSRAMNESPRALRATRPMVSPALEGVVQRAMARLPADRFASAAEFIGALTAVTLDEQRATPPRDSTAASLTQGLKTRGFTDPDIRGSAMRRSPAALVGVALAVLAVAGGLWYWSSLRNVSSSGTKRLAVLPFENLGGPGDAYFADGMTDEIRGKLSSLSGLQVTARSSAAQYKSTTTNTNTKSISQIGAELGVDYLLTGTIRWQDAAAGARRVRVSPELIRVSDGVAQWEQPFDTELNDVFRVQADIAQRVAQALDVALGATARAQLAERPTANLAAYEAFLRGQQLSANMTISDQIPLRKAVAEYQTAVGLDPSFALAWAQLSRAMCTIDANSPTVAGRDLCRTAAERAIAIAPDRPDTRLAMGVYFRVIERDSDKALEQFRAGLKASPANVDLLTSSATVERTLGRFEDAETHLRLASELDPRSVPAASILARNYRDLHRHAEAQREYERALTLAPTNLGVIQGRVGDYLSQGDLAAARRVIATALQHVDPIAVMVRFATFQEMMWVLPDDLRARIVDLQPSHFDNDRGMWALKVGNTYRLMGKMTEAKSFGEIAAAEYGKTVKAFPDDAQQQEFYGRALALAGRTREATQAAERSLALRPISLDAVNGPYYTYQAARIYLQSGMPDRALELIEPLLSKPGDITPGWLTIDPIFAPLKGNPRFDRMTQK